MTMTADNVLPVSDPAATPPRLLAAGHSAGALAHLSAFGPRRGLRRPDLERELERSGLTGRGGAAFPAFRKLAATAGRRAPIVIGNGSEGEPWSWKDAVLLANAPHLVLDGLLTASEALGAARTVLYLHEAAVAPVAAAVAERSDAGRVELIEAADGFVAGEASAVVNALQTGRAVPLDRTRRLSESGLDGRPTLLHNVETLAQLALVDRYGGDWFRSVGDPGQPGTRLVTVTGDVAVEGVLEVPTDATVVDIVARAGGEARLAAGVLLGGYHGRWIAPAETGTAPGSPREPASCTCSAPSAAALRRPRRSSRSWPRPPPGSAGRACSGSRRWPTGSPSWPPGGSPRRPRPSSPGSRRRSTVAARATIRTGPRASSAARCASSPATSTPTPRAAA